MPNPFNTPEPVTVAGFPLYKIGCLKKKEITALGLEPASEMNRLLQVYELAYEISEKEEIGEDEALQLVLNFGSGSNESAKLIKYVGKIEKIYSSIKSNAVKAEILLHSRLSTDWLSHNLKYVSDSFYFDLPDALAELLKGANRMPIEIIQLLVEELPETVINELANFIDKEAGRWQEPENTQEEESDATKKLTSTTDLENSEQTPTKRKSTGRTSTSKSKQVESVTPDLTPITLTSVA